MRSISETVSLRGGIASTKELLAAGHTPSGILTATRAGEVFKIRKGWYANPAAGRDVIQAWRVGGRLDCISAAAHHGLWVPEHSGLIHVCVPSMASRLRSPGNSRIRLAAVPTPDTRVHWTGSSLEGDRVAVSIPMAIRRICKCLGVDAGFVVLESALHLRKLRAAEMSVLLDGLAIDERRWLRQAGEQSESGTESELKLVLLRLGIPFQQQVTIDGVGRVDFLIGDHLVLEVDSKQFHSNPYTDRKRDAALSVTGRRVLRFMYSQVVHERAEVESAILAALSRLDHVRA